MHGKWISGIIGRGSCMARFRSPSPPAIYLVANPDPHRVYTTAQLVLLVGLVYLALAILSGCSGGTSSESSESIPPVASTCVHPSSNGSPPTNSLISPRANYTATLLPNGKVLVAGGAGDNGPLRSAELYD